MSIQQRVFECPQCGKLRDAPKAHGKTGKGHIKSMTCFTCKKKVNFVQLDEFERFKEIFDAEMEKRRCAN